MASFFFSIMTQTGLRNKFLFFRFISFTAVYYSIVW